MEKKIDVLTPTITVMQPRVINRDNTGDRSYDSEQGVIIKKSDIIFDYEDRKAKKRGFCI